MGIVAKSMKTCWEKCVIQSWGKVGEKWRKVGKSRQSVGQKWAKVAKSG